MKNLNEKLLNALMVGSLHMSKLRRSLSDNFMIFRKLYFKSRHDKPDAQFHREFCQIVSQMSKQRGMKVAIAAPRGSAKSTILETYVLYAICNKLEKFILIISNTAQQAENFLSSIKNELETNSLLIRDFPDVCEAGAKPGPPRWRQNEIIARNGIRILALGTGQQMRGIKHNEHRPSLIIMDDLESDEAIHNPDSYYKLPDWVNKTVLKAGTSETNIICVGTIHHYDSFLAKLTGKEYFPGWDKRIYKSVIFWSPQLSLWETWSKIYNYGEAFDGQEGPEAAGRFFEVHKESMLEATQVLWPETKTYYDLMIMREEDPVSFDSEMQNEPINPRDCMFNLSEVHYWDDRFGSEEELMATLGDSRYIYGACDPSLGRQNARGDFSAIITAVRDSETGTIYILDADISRRLPDKTITEILAYHKRRKYSTFAFESNQFQELMAKELRERSNAEGSYLNIKDFKNTTDKRARIEVLQPMVKNGTIQFSKKHKTLLEQMKYFPKGAHDDGLDALEMVVRLCKDSGEACVRVADWDFVGRR